MIAVLVLKLITCIFIIIGSKLFQFLIPVVNKTISPSITAIDAYPSTVASSKVIASKLKGYRLKYFYLSQMKLYDKPEHIR